MKGWGPVAGCGAATGALGALGAATTASFGAAGWSANIIMKKS